MANEPEETEAENIERLRQMCLRFADYIPFDKDLGIEVLELDRATATFRLPYRAELVGNPETGVVHGGVVTALLDTCSGSAVFMAHKVPSWFATLDLRIDYLRPAAAGVDIFARARCYKMTRNVAFTTAVAYETDPDDPIATSSGTFMLQTHAKIGGMP